MDSLGCGMILLSTGSGYSDPNNHHIMHLFYDPLSGVTTQYPIMNLNCKTMGINSSLSLMRIKLSLNVAKEHIKRGIYSKILMWIV